MPWVRYWFGDAIFYPNGEVNYKYYDSIPENVNQLAQDYAYLGYRAAIIGELEDGGIHADPTEFDFQSYWEDLKYEYRFNVMDQPLLEEREALIWQFRRQQERCFNKIERHRLEIKESESLIARIEMRTPSRLTTILAGCKERDEDPSLAQRHSPSANGGCG